VAAGLAKLPAKGLITGFGGVTFKGGIGWLGILDCNIGCGFRALTAATAANGFVMIGGLGDEATGDIGCGGLGLKGWLRGIAALKFGYFCIFLRISCDDGEFIGKG